MSARSMLDRWTLRGLAAAVAAAVFACLSPAACAQLGQGLTGISTLSAAPSSDLPAGYARDVINGNGTRGPYSLSWNNIPPSRETIVIDGRVALRSVDYAIDYTKGQISFTNVLSATGLARVEYPVDAAHSARNASTLSVPLALDVYDTDRSSVQFTALYKQASGASTQTGSTVLGMKGETQLGASTSVKTAFYTFAGTTGASQGFQGRSAAQFSAASKLGSGVSLTGSYIRTGLGFAGAGDYGLKTGQETDSLGVAWNPAGGRLAYASTLQRLDLLGVSGGSVTTTAQHNLSYNLGAASKLALSRLQVDSAVGSQAAHKVTDVYQLDTKLGMKTSARVSLTNVQAASGDTQSQTQSTYLSVNSAPVSAVSVSAVAQTTDNSTDGGSSSLDMNVSAKPAKALEVQASFNGRDSDSSGADNTGTVRVAAAPLSHIKVSAGVSDRQTLLAGMRSQDFRVEAQPGKSLSMSGGYGYTDDGSAITIVRDIKAMAKGGSLLSLEGLYKNRDYGINALDSSGVSVTLNPARGLGVLASVLQNPEDSKGVIQRYGLRSLGLKASAGILSFTGDYSYKDEYLLGREWFQTRLGMGLALARATQLTGGYEYSETQDALGTSTRRVSVGFTRDLGSDFNLSLSGARIEENDISSDSQKRSYEANLQFGLRF